MPREKKQSIIIVMIFVALGAAGVFLFPETTVAQIPSQILPSCNWEQGETYGFGAFVEVASRIMKLIWGILGSLALVMFIWGGFLWLTARGEEQQIKQGWDTLINAVIGILIVLGSWVIINTIILSLTNPTSWKVAQLFGGPNWNELAGGTICEQIAIRKAGTAPWSKGGGGGTTAPPALTGPVPGGGKGGSGASAPAAAAEKKFSFNNANVPIFTPEKTGSVEVPPELISGTAPSAAREILSIVSLVMFAPVIPAFVAGATTVTVAGATLTIAEATAVKQAPSFFAQVALKNVGKDALGSFGKLANPGILFKEAAVCAQQSTVCSAAESGIVKILNSAPPDFLTKVVPNAALLPKASGL